MKPFVLAAAVLLFTASSGGADACSYVRTFNPYANWLGRLKPGDTAKAATIDWVHIEAAPPPACTRPPPFDAARKGEVAYLKTELSPACSATYSDGLPPAFPFVAVVKESLKGNSTPRFVLAHESWRTPGEWSYFSDARAMPADRAYLVAREQKAEAESRHADDAYWDRAGMSPPRDASGTCGGVPTLEPRLDYIVYRDAGGLVIGLAPVIYEDDRLLRRLRLAKSGGPLNESLGLSDFFRSADGLLLVEVEACHWPRTGSWYDKRTEVRVVKGDPEAFPRMAYVDIGTGESDYRRVPGVDADIIYDWALAKGRRCGADRLVLLVKSPVPGVAPPGDDAWALISAPGLPDATHRLYTDELPLSAPEPQDRVARLHGKQIITAELDTGLSLDGPSVFTVEQAFAWFEAGALERARRGPAAKTE